MNRLTKTLIISVFSFASLGVIQSYAAEWYESMEASSLDQSHSVWKNISTSGSATQRPDVQQAIAEISESVSREAAQIAESASVRELDASNLPSVAVSGGQEDTVITAGAALKRITRP